MTTTLRPTGPEERAEDGGRRRSFAIADNGRPVGALTLATDSRFAHRAGRLLDLTVEPAERRRGRGTVAVLAAEEVLRGWGCGQADATVDAGAEDVLRLATALGYQPSGRLLTRELTKRPAPLPAGSSARPMTEAEFDGWLAEERAGYARSWVARGVPEQWAAFRADTDVTAALADGLDSAGAVLRVLEHDGTPVGSCWLDLGRTPEEVKRGPMLLGVRVAEEHRGHGHGRTLLGVAERLAVESGTGRLTLHVFAGNVPASRLYASLGYRPVRLHLTKPLK
ncbi:GNAT family N-acetyltransferase [Streptomyces sp. NBRC 109706]|uniref:GNAT family N-acetyltransferase n=1 Tax=Streptomyces sp. NBRC 109706 TaxID=1550035 RepID=UPI000781449F|nr:GNAT family N-acetyltransferase [Streptomyces sp. NBRC 109706]